MKRFFTFLALLLVVLFLVACSSIKAGTVTAKEYHEPYSYITMQCYSYNAKGVCTVQMPVTHHTCRSGSPSCSRTVTSPGG